MSTCSRATTMICAPGSVVVGGTESTWSRCELAAFRDAWSAAQTEARRLLAGS